MYPYIELFWKEISMVGIGIVISFIVFMITAWILTKRNHQDFLKLFYWLPAEIILAYILGRYVSFSLETWIYLPSSMSNILEILSPKNFDFHFVGLLIATWISLTVFFSSIKRTENKKIWADILFVSFANALIVFGIFLTLWDTVVWKPTDSIFAIRALTDNSALTKFDGVYPIWLFLSFWTLIIHIIISLSSIISKKNWLWMWWLIWILVIFNIMFIFQSYPRHWIITIFDASFDIKQYISLLAIIYCIITTIKWEKKRFY